LKKGGIFLVFNYESDFEEALIKLLTEKGWEKEIIRYPSEEQLINNWAKILFENNRNIDKLNNYPLTKGEMRQILEQVTNLRTPLKLNGFINGKTVSIIRDNPDDDLHFGKAVSLKIYDRHEIAAGQSRYQIVQQPDYRSSKKLVNNNRGDLLLLINGMPVIAIELKRSANSISQAYSQISKYSEHGVYSGIYSLIQIFVAMNPEEAVYFANPGPDGKFNPDYYFHWADFDNKPINYWKDVASSLLSIPMAHQMIGFYTVADDSDGILKVMRSYQYYAASAISDKVAKIKWGSNNQLGGYIWHTTGSGKTMTSFKSAQLIANSNDADKVVFLTDRIELGTQSLKEYRAFADENESVQATENTYVLISKLKSNDHRDSLIVTSIQKMSNIQTDELGLNEDDIRKINTKRLVFIVDEAHRSTFGEMLITIKETFPKAIFFGFTGTPIFEENQKKLNTTSTVFGDELHRYSIADGIIDKNVLGFDPYKILTFKDLDLRREIALQEAKSLRVVEAISDPIKALIYYKFMDDSKVKMAGYLGPDGKYVKGIEDYISNAQYRGPTHQNMVVDDIVENWQHYSRDSKFHSIFATSSIHEAIEYYRIFSLKAPHLKVTCLFDPTIDNNESFIFKEDGLVEIMDDYNTRYGFDFNLASHAAFKKDVSSRLAHKEQYKWIDDEPEKQLDILIVVDQMLTGFDSKWVNTLYLDKLLKAESIIQAFSRTNRLFGSDKPHGTIRYYRKPHTMEKNIEAAVKLYSGDRKFALFVLKLKENLEKLNFYFKEIDILFKYSGIENFERLPDDYAMRSKFAQQFNLLQTYLEASRIQGFTWKKNKYEFKIEGTRKKEVVEVLIDEHTYLTLVKRYKEMIADIVVVDPDIPFEIDGYITTIPTDDIDATYMNSRFEKYLKLLNTPGASAEAIKQMRDELHKTFALLTQEEQKYANIYLHEIERGEAIAENNQTLRDYITGCIEKAKKDQIHIFAETFGLDEEKLREMMLLRLTSTNLNEFGRFDDLKNTADKEKAKTYFDRTEGIAISMSKANIKLDKILREFLLKDGFDL